MAIRSNITRSGSPPEISGASISHGDPKPMLMQTQTAEVNFHQIEDTELQSLVNLNAPVSFGLATTAAGAFVGLLPTVIPAASKVYTEGKISTPDLVYIISAAVSLVCTIIFGCLSAGGLSAGKKRIIEIRNRPRRQL